MENLEIYNKVRECPADALRQINAGKLKGKSDINPMWRIKALTEQFGPCGIGWYYKIDRQWQEVAPDGQTISAFCNIDLYYKYNGEWSMPIPGTGGANFTGLVGVDRRLDVSDECYKMALTDAISVAAKALGVAADVYWAGDRTKYTAATQQQPQPQPAQPQSQPSQRDGGIETLKVIATINATKTVDELKAEFGKLKESNFSAEDWKAVRMAANAQFKKIGDGTKA